MKRLSLLLEQNKKTYDYGCIMLNFKDIDPSLTKPFTINKSDVFDNENNEYGIENEPHVTILYGLHDWEIKDNDLFKIVEDVIKKPIEIKLVKVSYFETKNEYDVVKWDVESEDLTKLNKKIAEKFPYTTDYPDYHPHMTIMYVKKGKGKKYEFEPEEPIVLSSNLIKYTKSTGKKKFLRLKFED